MNAPSITRFVPYSTISIILLVLAFKYDMAIAMLEMNANYWNLSKSMFLLYFSGTVVALMFAMQFLWIAAIFIKKHVDDYFENIRLEKVEREALIALFHSLNGQNWKDNTSWCSKDHITYWKGVRINPHSRRVNKILLPDNNLTGCIPPEIGNLKYLIEIDLRRNEIKGRIPEEFCQLERLEGLYLHDNYLEGVIPESISELPCLSGIYLFNNCFEEREKSVEIFKANMGESAYVFI